jgi:hypothetical protein
MGSGDDLGFKQRSGFTMGQAPSGCRVGVDGGAVGESFPGEAELRRGVLTCSLVGSVRKVHCTAALGAGKARKRGTISLATGASVAS